MATKEEILETKTHKNDGLDISKRVFYALIGEGEERKWQTHRNSKAIALLFKALREQGSLTDKRIDDILLEVIS